MDQRTLVDLLREVSARLCKDPYKFGNLVYTQTEGKSNRRIVREPEACHVLACVCSERKIDFGLEVPTQRKYRFTGPTPDTANTDLAVLSGGEQVNVELKVEQPAISNISKDLEKLLAEGVSGAAMFHILRNSNRNTVPSLLLKYRDAYTDATRKTASLKSQKPKWFVLFILIRRRARCLWRAWDDVTQISETDFNQDGFNAINLV